MSDLPGDTDSMTAEQPKGTRRKERPKKPSSRFNVDAMFLAEPPKSPKKKVTRGDNEESTTSK